MKELVEKLSGLFTEFSKEAASQAEQGNKAAGQRARKASLEIEKALKEFRKISISEGKSK
ncbi:histone H1 [Dysgonomonas sp. GY75]|uniref:histone H1 n=1 Tax=Dysgonomonas sp. GY75 TaxID=2780419 RepID=UPI001883EC9C|nr:histone H1 [Dysgonomonas sp. GY75]MBF0650790.1 histone H1 [Dysgonomonas sp. GY75]